MVRHEAKSVESVKVIWSSELKELKVGLRISREKGLSFFGLHEVNVAIEQGAKVVAIKEGDALMQKTEESDENIRLNLTGFSIIVVIDS